MGAKLLSIRPENVRNARVKAKRNLIAKQQSECKI